MAAIQDLIKGLGEGWTLVNGVPQEEMQPAQTGMPAKGTGLWYVIVAGPDGQQRNLYLKPKAMPGPRPNHPQIVVATGGELPAGANKTEEYTKYEGKLEDADWDQAEPIKDVPAGREPASALGQLEYLDEQGALIKPGDTTTKRVYIRDPKAPAGTPPYRLADAAEGGSVTAVGDTMYLVKRDGSATPVRDANGAILTKPKDKQVMNVAGIGLVEYDPASSSTTTLIAAPADPTKEIFQVANGDTYRWDTATKQWFKTDLPHQAKADKVWTDENTDQLVWYDEQGNVIAQHTKPGWQRPAKFQPSAPPTSTTLKQIPSINPQTGALEYTDNPNQITASQATSDLAAKLGLQVAAGSMTEEAAQNLITNAVNAMNAQASALNQQVTGATAGLGQITQGAQVGAGMLNQRVSSASSLLNNLAGIPGQAGKNMLVAPPAGTGAMLAGGVGNYVTDLGGGPGVYQAAANLVQRADPTNQKFGGDAAAMYAVLGQAMQKFQDMNGKPHPLQQAALNSPMPAAGGGMTAPVSTGTNVINPNPLGAGTSGIGVSPTAAPMGTGFMSAPMRTTSTVTPTATPNTFPNSAGIGIGPTNAPMGVGFSSPAITPPQPTIVMNF